MANYNSTLQTNNTDLQAILNQINELPEAGGKDPVLQDKTVTPTTSSQTIKADSGYDGLDTVTVNAMPTATQATPAITINASGLITATATQTAGYVAAGSKSATKQLTTQAAKTITPSTSSQTAVAKGVYTTGAVIVAAIPSTYVKPAATKAATTYTPTTSNQTIAAGTYCSGAQTIKGDANLVAGNIKSGVSIFGVAGSYEGSGGSSGGGFPNGTEWTQSNIKTGTFYSICNANGLWVAAGSTGLYHSTDGKIWEQSNVTSDISYVKFGDDIWVAAGSTGLYYSTDGKTWINSYTNRVSSPIAYGKGLWVTSSSTPLYSSNGKNWHTGTISVSKASFTSIAYGKDTWVATLGTSGVYYSTDGKSWKQGSTSIMVDIKYSNGMWIGVESFYGSKIYYSYSGATWIENTDLSDLMFVGDSGLAYEKGKWLICDLAGVWSSSDGKTWELIPNTEGVILSGIQYINGIWTAVGCSSPDSENIHLLYSFDGITWSDSNILMDDYSLPFPKDNTNGIWVSSAGIGQGLCYSVSWEPTI